LKHFGTLKVNVNKTACGFIEASLFCEKLFAKGAVDM
jgi:hypothetical protein